MTGLRRALTQYGRPFATYKYKPLLGSGVAQSQRLHAFVQATANHFGSGEVDVVGHSYGGLLLRRMQQDSKGRGVRKLVLLAVPHHGSGIAVFAPGRAGRDLQPGSSFLKSLKSSGSFGETLDLRASCDAMIHPREAAILHDGSERLDGAWGHNSMLVAPETIQRVMRFLDDAVVIRPESD